MCIKKSMHKNALTLMGYRDQDNSMFHEGIKCRPRLCQTFNMDSATTSNRFNVVSVEALTVKDFSESRRASKAFNRFGNRTRINKKCHDGEPCNQSIDCIAWPKSVDMTLWTILPDRQVIAGLYGQVLVTNSMAEKGWIAWEQQDEGH